jgi:hypothetical protein
MLASFLTTLLFATSVVCATQSARMLGGTEANFWRLAVATALLAVWAHTFGQGLTGASFALFVISGVIGVGADVFLFQALPRHRVAFIVADHSMLFRLVCGHAGMAVAGHQALRPPGCGLRPNSSRRGRRAWRRASIWMRRKAYSRPESASVFWRHLATASALSSAAKPMLWQRRPIKTLTAPQQPINV